MRKLYRDIIEGEHSVEGFSDHLNPNESKDQEYKTNVVGSIGSLGLLLALYMEQVYQSDFLPAKTWR